MLCWHASVLPVAFSLLSLCFSSPSLQAQSSLRPAPSNHTHIPPFAPAGTPTTPLALVMPTDNDGLLRHQPTSFYMYVDRTFENQTSSPWQGGQYGFVRGPVRHGSQVVMMAFHEGLDIAPLKRDSLGEPLDEVRSISHGDVVHVNHLVGASNYGKYVVIRHHWADGPFYSLYAHLAHIDVEPGRTVLPGTPLGIMGHTGVGLDRRRSHLHLELNLFLSSRFPEWHEKNFRPSPNHHGLFNGLNLSGLDLAKLYLQRQSQPNLSIAQFIKATPPEWKVLIPRNNQSLEILQNYPWLLDPNSSADGKAWEISFSGSGLPLNVQVVPTTVTRPTVSWVHDTGIPHLYHTRKYVSGNGGKGTLTASGLRYIELISGDFIPPAPK